MQLPVSSLPASPVIRPLSLALLSPQHEGGDSVCQATQEEGGGESEDQQPGGHPGPQHRDQWSQEQPEESPEDQIHP